MSLEAIAVLMVFVLGVIFGVICWLLNNKDAQQEKKIDDLFAKHQADADKLVNLELIVAGQHYKKSEIDALMKDFREYLDKRFDRLEDAVNK